MNWQNPTFTLIVSAISLALALYAIWQIAVLNRLKKTFFAGSKAGDLESVILRLEQELQNSRLQQDALENALAQVRSQLSFAVQKVGVVRFNPFDDGGGNFSFTLAILDEHNTGVVITSMHGRQQNRVYTKKIDNGISDNQLTDEELQAIKIANSPSKTDTESEVKPKSKIVKTKK